MLVALRRRVQHTFRSYKSYLLLVLVPYVLLVVVFHMRLQVVDHGAEVQDATHKRDLELEGNGHNELRPEYQTRNLRLNNTSKLLDEKHALYMQARGRGAAQGAALKPIPEPQSSREAFVQHGKKLVNMNEHNPSGYIKQSKHPYGHTRWQQKEPQQSNVTANSYHDLWWSNHKHHALPVPAHCMDTLHHLDYVHFKAILGNYLYSAYYDTRQPDGPQIRIMALMTKQDKPALYCHFEEAGSGAKHITTSPMTYYQMCENHEKPHGGWILSCAVPDAFRVKPPCEVTVSRHINYDAKRVGNVQLPIFVLENSAPTSSEHRGNTRVRSESEQQVKKVEFGLCISPLFGHIPSMTLIEFIELSVILGAQHLVFYAYKYTKEVAKVLEHYERKGLITVLPWDLPVADKTVWYHGQLMAINDCLYRNMHRFQYTMFNDIDEFLVPHKHANWTEMLRSVHEFSLSNPRRHCGYSFQSAFFDPLLSGTERNLLYDLESDLRSKTFSKVRSKILVDPTRIFEVGIHHISKPISDVYMPEYVTPDVAFLHHYRKCVTDFDPKMNCQVYARDESVSRFIPLLRHNVHDTLWKLKEAEKQKGHKFPAYNIV